MNVGTMMIRIIFGAVIVLLVLAALVALGFQDQKGPFRRGGPMGR